MTDFKNKFSPSRATAFVEKKRAAVQRYLELADAEIAELEAEGFYVTIQHANGVRNPISDTVIDVTVTMKF